MLAAVRTFSGILALVLLSGCHYVAPPIQMYGASRDLEGLAGEWWGEYVGDRDHGRRGSITFKLVAGQDQAHGDVLMTPEGLERPYERYRGDGFYGRPETPESASHVLSIRFVSAAHGTVSGVLDPYWDPDRGTRASATFWGEQFGDTIQGTFTTRYASGAAETGGRWHVTRVRPTPRE